MNDIVERLKDHGLYSKVERTRALFREAYTEIERLRGAPAQGVLWHLMDVKPDHPMMADLFYRDLFFTDYKTDKKISAVMERGRDERFGIGWWDGETWFHSGTAHELFENYSEYPKEQFPTHWRPLDVSAFTSTPNQAIEKTGGGAS